MEWKAAYALGIEIVDGQHQRFVQMQGEAQRFYAESMDGVGSEGFHSLTDARQTEIMSLVMRLRDYAFVHFRDEERLMRESRYSGYIRHRLKHNLFCQHMLSYEARVLAGDFYLLKELLRFTSDWFVNHMTGDDRVFGEHYRKTMGG